MAKKTTTKKNNPTETLLKAVIHGIEERKGKHIICLDLRKLEQSVSDYFIICEGDSTTQVDAIADSVHNEVKKATGENPSHTEGFENAEWILMDYFNVVVHIFLPETREFYNLERLWSDAEIIKI